MTNAIIQEFRNLLGSNGWLSQADATGYSADWLKTAPAAPLGVARPASTEAVAGVLEIANRYNINLIPQGGNTGLVLGSVPRADDVRAIIVTLERMNKIEHIDPVGRTVRVQAGVVLEQLQNALADHQLTFPVHLGSGGSAQIGGLISTNAGGCHAHRHGMMSDQVLGLEVALPNGQVWSGNRALIKDNAGYALKRLFCGAEGTLGIVTSATLKTLQQPYAISTLMLACDGLEDALKILSMSQGVAGPLLNAAEFMDELGIKLLLKQCPAVKNPLETIPPITLLLEFISPSSIVSLDAMIERVITESMQHQWASDGVASNNAQQRADMWTLRESIPEGQRLHGAQLKHDVSVPVAALPSFIKAASDACKNVMDSILINPFGHLADGNVHFNLSAPKALESEMSKQAAQLNRAVYDAVLQFDGSIAAEHGLGRSKVALADNTRTGTERFLMKRVKKAIDPAGIMNPGVIVSASDEVPETSG